jgi:type II secretion system protein N
MSSSIAGLAGQFGRLFPRRYVGRWSFGYVAWTLAWFVVFFALTFPHDLVVRRWTDDIAAQSGWRVRYDEAWLRPWNGYHLSQVSLIAPGKDTEPWLSASEVVFRPSLGSGGFPFYFSGQAYGGDFAGSIDQSGALWLSWNQIALSKYQRLTALLDGSWDGALSGDVHFSGRGELKNIEGRGKLGLKSASLTQAKAQGFAIPDLHFANGDAEFELKAGRLDVRSLKLSGSELDAELHGQLFLLAANQMPAVNAVLSVKPIPGAPAGFEPLLTLLNHNQKPPGGSYSFTLYGPLNALRVR